MFDFQLTWEDEDYVILDVSSLPVVSNTLGTTGFYAHFAPWVCDLIQYALGKYPNLVLIGLVENACNIDGKQYTHTSNIFIAQRQGVSHVRIVEANIGSFTDADGWLVSINAEHDITLAYDRRQKLLALIDD